MLVTDALAVRVPASSANLGAGFDVLGMGLDLYLDAGLGRTPSDARAIDGHHPTAKAFVAAGGPGGEPMWVRSSIPVGRGLGFSGAARVAGAALAVAMAGSEPDAALSAGLADVAEIAAGLEGHGDNAGASVFGGIVAWVDGRVLPLRIGPRLAEASAVVWIPDATTSTDRSRGALPGTVARADAVHNLGRVAQFVLAVEHDDPTLLVASTDDRLHQGVRLALVPGAAEALDVGVAAGAWCAWLSGSGPTVAFLVAADSVDAVIAALPESGQVKRLGIARRGVHLMT